MQDLVRNATKYEEIENIKISDHSAHEIYRNTNWWPNLYLLQLVPPPGGQICNWFYLVFKVGILEVGVNIRS